MRHLTTLAAVILSFSIGCAAPEGLSLKDRDQIQKHGRPIFGAPIALPGTDQIMFPFAVETDDEGKLGFGGGFSSGGSFMVSGSSGFGGGSSTRYYGGDRLTWNNVAFYDPKSGSSRLLLDRPALICIFHARNDKDGPVYGDYTLFGIAPADSNHDGIINRDDAVRLYRAGIEGTGLTAITAEDTKLIDLNNAGGLLYLRVLRDADGDGKFTAKDPIEVLRVDPRRWDEPQRVLPDDLRKQALDAAAKPHSQP